MKKFFFIPLCTLLIACSSHKNEEVVIKDLTKATDILSKRNSIQFQRIEKLYQSDTSNKLIKGLYEELSFIRQYKEEYKNAVLNNSSAEIQKENKRFLDKAIAQLDPDEQKIILMKFKESPIVSEEAFNALEQDHVLPFTLALESEMITQEMYLIVLKDFKKKKSDFDWEIYW